MKTFFTLTVLLLAAAAINCAPEPYAFEASDDEKGMESLEDVLAEGFEEVDEQGMEDIEMQDDDDENAVIQVAYQNHFDRNLHVQCNVRNGEALYRVQSRFSTGHRDRQFRFDCQKVANVPLTSCKWSGYLNNFDQPIGYTCPTNTIMAGIWSYHYNRQEDRRWRAMCCSAKGYHTEGCELTANYINNFRATFDYAAKSSCKEAAFAGLYSFDNNRYHDRRWKMYTCQLKKNS